MLEIMYVDLIKIIKLAAYALIKIIKLATYALSLTRIN